MSVTKHTARLGLFGRKLAALSIILVLLFTDLMQILNVPLLPSIERAHAATGDFSIFRESIGTETLPSDQTPYTMRWDTDVATSSNITLASNDSDITLVEGGKYLVLYNLWAEQGTSTAGSQRRSFETYLSLDGVESEYGRAFGFLRDSDNTLFAPSSGGAILEAEANDVLRLTAARDDVNTGAGTNIRANINGISVLKLKDNWDYLRLHRSATGTAINGNTAFTDVEWQTVDEVDTGSFGFTATSGAITLLGSDTDHFLVTANIRLRNTALSNTRQNYEMMLTLDGAEIEGTRVTGYSRGNQNSEQNFTTTLSYTGIIAKDVVGSQTLNVELRRESTASANTVIVPDESAISIAALPDTGSYVRLSHDATQTLATSPTPVNFNTQFEADSTAFSHSTTTNSELIGIDAAGDYLFFSTVYSQNSSNERQPHRIDWEVSGATQSYGAHGAYVRGNQTFTGGSSAGLLVPGLSSSDTIEITQYDETEAPVNNNLQADRVAIQGVLLNEDFFGVDVLVTATGTQTVSSQIPETGVELGGTFVLTENTSSRNISTILFSESGSIDAANHLDNIGLYYDLDTTAPYDCASESFTSTSTENQFGSTDTNGFSGADGVTSYDDSVSISTTQAFCGYIVFDVTAGASDDQTIDISITDIKNDITVTGGGSIGPAGVADIDGVTTLADAEVTQIRYHWRNDDGSETTATSLTGGIEDTIGNGFQPGTVRRLRVEVSAEGSITSPEMQYRLQYGEKGASCAAITTWINVADEGGAWNTDDSASLTFAQNATNISIGTGGVSDEGSTFIGTNTVLDTGDKSLNTTLDSGDFAEFEFTVVPTASAIEGTTYCFRLVDETPDTTHSFRIPVTVQSAEVDDDLTDFPVYVDMADLGSHFFNNVKSDGADIRVTESDGTTEVAREVVAINTGSDSGELYFRAANLASTTNTTFYIYYGGVNANEYQASSTYGAYGVWDDNYLGVYHMLESSTGAVGEFIDSSGEHNHGTGEGTTGLPSTATGQLGVGQDFVAANEQRIDLGAPARWTSIGTNSELMMSAWINLDDSASDYAIVSQWNSGASGNLFWADSGGLGTGFCYYNGAYMPSDCQDLNDQNPGVWEHVVARYDGAAGGVYVNGVATGAGQTATTFSQDAVNFSIASINGDSSARSFNGLVDEVRISDIDRGEAWITTEFSNQSTTTNFYATSTHEAVSETAANIIYSIYPEANITADVTVSATGTQTATFDDPSVDNYLGGAFTFVENTAARNLTDVTLSASGTIDAQNSVDQIRLYYDFDTSLPFNCASESFDGTEPQFGATSTGFSAANGTTTFSALETTSINTTQALCMYVVLDVTSSSTDGETLDVYIAAPNNDVVLSSGSVGPGTETGINGVSTIQGPVRTLVHYHWRNDNGSETGATSASGDIEDVQITAVPQESTRRLRLGISNEGALTSPATIYQLEYGTKVTSCAAVTNWNVVGAGSTTAWAMVDSPNITHGADTTNIAVSQGGVTDENTFLASNSGVRDLTASSTAITLTTTQQLELEFSIEATTESGFDTEYCFRVSDEGNDLETYNVYAEIRTREKRDFFIQQGFETVTGNSVTLTAGTDYIAPASSSLAFIRMTNTQITGAGRDTGGTTQDADDVTAFFSDPQNLDTSVTITRPTGAADNTRVAWEIIEFVGIAGTDNEMKVRDVGTVTYGSTALFATGTAVSGVVDNSDVVVFITGQLNPDTGASNYNDGISTAAWNSTSSVPVFQRGDNDNVAAQLSYAVVEFTGANWKIQRSEHTYSSISAETETIEAVNSLTRTFLHTQKRAGNGESGLHDMGHEVYLSSLGQITYTLEDGTFAASDAVTNPTLHTSVAWVIENTQTGTGEMLVYRSNGVLGENPTSCGGVEPCREVVDIGNTAETAIDPTNTSIWSNNTSEGGGTAYPRPIIAARLTSTSTTQYEFWRSEDGQRQTYRTEVVEWPIAEISVRQNYYRFYVNEDAQTPTDPWPVGVADLGENTSITVLDDPVGETEVVRIRMTLLINNSSLPAQSESYKLQYGVRDTSCSAVTVWTDVGAVGSGAIWRGFDNPTPVDGSALSATDPPTGGDTLISLTDRAGTYEESNSTAVNPYKVRVGEDVEYDWVIEHNGATEKTFYCFRMVESDGTELTGYTNYPTLRTSGYSPVVVNWQWFDDETSLTPSTSLAPENIAPTDVTNTNIIKLRTRVDEIDGATGNNVKFKLQYSETPNFTAGVFDVAASTTCSANSIWCYADGTGDDNQIIDSTVLTGVDGCVSGVGDGCGTHNEATSTASSFSHGSLNSTEFEFTLQHAGARVNRTYYFRLFDVSNEEVVLASTTNPSLVTEGAQLLLTLDGIPTSTVTEGVTTDAATSAGGIQFGSIPVNTEFEVAHRVTVDTNATEGYKVYLFSRSELLDSYGTPIASTTGTNATPVAWSVGCSTLAVGCFGYHAGDDTLEGSTRFSPNDTYAALSETPEEIMFSSVPAITDSSDIIYKIQIDESQPAGQYQADIVYIATPVF